MTVKELLSTNLTVNDMRIMIEKDGGYEIHCPGSYARLMLDTETMRRKVHFWKYIVKENLLQVNVDW